MDIATIKTPEKIFIHGEECLKVDGCNMYVISEGGHVYRVEAWSKWEEHLKATEPDLVYFSELKRHLRNENRNRNYRISLQKNDGKSKNFSLPYLVCKTFGTLPKRFDSRIQNFVYLDGDKENNHYTNIEVVKGSSGYFKLTFDQAKQIKNYLAVGYTLKKLAEMYGVSDMQIYRIKSGENWNKGKRLIEPKTTPFYIADGKIRRNLAQYDTLRVSDGIRKPFTIKRNPADATDNFIIGIINGYKFTIHHKNITIATKIVEGLNKYFFDSK